MPVASDQSRDQSTWQRELARAIRDPRELVACLGLPESLLPRAIGAARVFPLLVPRGFAARMQPGDPADPLLRQVMPLDLEEHVVPGFVADAVNDQGARRAPGLLQKYQRRALLIATGACAVHCRYCFRRHYPYAEEPRRLDEWQPAIEAIAADQSLTEVILSGGDPLVLSDSKLGELVGQISRIAHVRRLRVHTRLPIVLPERVTDSLLDVLRQPSATVIVVVHANHARELAGDCRSALGRLRGEGLLMLNQAVLLRGVNDSVEAQVELAEALIELGVVPYYLHQLDRVSGTAHFEVSEERGRQILREMRQRLPGYAVPRYVREAASTDFKVPLDIDY